MNEGLFKAQLNNISDILKDIELYEDRNFYPIYPKKPAALFRRVEYKQIWEICFREQYYDFQLIDDSLLQFRIESYSPLLFSYVYYECPYTYSIPFLEFLKDYCGIPDWESPHHRRKDFDEYYLLAENKNSVTPIRYDFSPDLYTEGLHPAAHIHFGHNSNVRVGTKKLLKPISFLCFIIRQVYPNYWQKFLQLAYAETISRNIRGNLIEIENKYWNSFDDWEMSLI